MREVNTAKGLFVNRIVIRLTAVGLFASAFFGSARAQEGSGEAEMRTADRFRSQVLYDSSIVHYSIAKGFFEASARRDLYYRCIAGIGDNLLRKTEFVAADSLLRGAEAGAWKELGEDHQGVAEIHYLLGYLRTFQDRHEEANKYYEHARAIWERIYGPRDIRVASVYYGEGILLERRGVYDSAMVCLTRAKAIQSNIGDSGRVALANTLSAMGSLYELTNEPSKAIKEFSEATSLLDDAGFSESPSSEYCFHSLAICCKEIGQMEKAVDFEKKALDISKRIYGERHLAVAGALGQLGDYLVSMGDVELALQHYKESHSIIVSLVGPNHSSANELDRKMAGLYAFRGEREKALKIYLRVASQHAHDFGADNPELGSLYHEVAEIYRKKGEFRKAFEFYSKALRLRQKIHGSAERLDIAGILHDEARALTATGKYDSAAVLLRRSLSILDESPAGNPELRSSIFESLADISRKKGDAGGAVHLYQQALIAASPGFRDTSFLANPEVPGTAYCRDYVRIMAGKAHALIEFDRKSPAMEKQQGALKAYLLAADGLKELRNSYRSEGSKLMLQEEGSSVYLAGLAVAYRIAEKTDDRSAKEAAFSFFENGKAMILLESLENAKVKHFAGIPDRILEDKRRLERELAALLARAEWEHGTRDSGNSSASRAAILEKNWKIDRLGDSLAHINPEFSRLSRPGRVALPSEVQHVLDSVTCLIAYTIGPEAVYCFMIRRDSFDLLAMHRPRNLDSLAGQLRQALKTLNDQSYLFAARKLYADLMLPLEKHLRGVKRLVIIPDGSLYYLPFEVLLSANTLNGTESTGRIDFSQLSYLVNRFEISYALSGTLFCEARENMEMSRGRSLSFAGFAPVTGGPRVGSALATNPLISQVGFGGRKSTQQGGHDINPLPFSEDEVKSIAAAFNDAGGHGEYTAGSAATKQDFRAQSPGHSIIHIATHGFIDEEHPDQSSLLFAPGPDSLPDQDALLYAGEVYDLRLDADLVTLSSCESGAGKLVRGEGLMAMTRGFFYAGARNLVCSLWKVYDRQTNQLMRGFYRHVLRGRGFSAALREAKLGMIKNAATAHPFKWAGFELIGE